MNETVHHKQDDWQFNASRMFVRVSWTDKSEWSRLFSRCFSRSALRSWKARDSALERICMCLNLWKQNNVSHKMSKEYKDEKNPWEKT